MTKEENFEFTAYAVGVIRNIEDLRQLVNRPSEFTFPLVYCIGDETLENRKASAEALLRTSE